MEVKRKIHKWTQEDLDFLRTSINKFSWEEIAARIGVTVIACKRKAKEVGVKKLPVLKKINNKISNRPTQQDSLERMFNTKPTKPITRDDSGTVPFFIPEINLTVQVRPGFDPEQVRNKYLHRK